MSEWSEPPEWRRVSPIAILFFALSFVRRLISQGLNLLPVVAILLVVNDSLRNLALQYGVVALVVGALGMGTWQFLVFRYQVEARRLHLRQGLLQRQILTLEYARIQQADIQFPWYYRPFGLAVLSLDSAGSAQQEVVISGLGLTDAEHLRDLIQGHQPADGAVKETGAPGPDYELQLSNAEVLRYGLMHNGLLVLASLMLPVLNSLLQSLDLSLEARVDALTSEWSLTQPQWAGMLFLVALAAVGLLVLASSLAGLVSYQGYRLERRDDHLQSRAGLVSITTRSVRLRRIQMIVLKLSWVGRLLRRQTLVLHTAGDHGNQAQATGDSQRFLVPVLTSARSQSLLNELHVPRTPHWSRVSHWYAVAGGVQVLLVVALVLAALFALAGPGVWWLLAVVVSALWLGTVWPRWRRLGVYRDAQWLGVREGLLGYQTRWLPVGKIQSVRLTASLWQRRAGVATLHIRGSGGQLVMPCLTSGQAERWRDELLCEIARHHDTWF